MPGNNSMQSFGEFRLIRQDDAVYLDAPEGTFSYYHPREIFTGFSWDALSASPLLARRRVESILILGLGGGTAARQCRLLYPDAEIVGVERDPEVLRAAKTHFGLANLAIKMVESPGESYLDSCGRRFDAILDDMWPVKPDAPKVFETNPNWIETVRSCLSARGVHAINIYSRSRKRSEFRLAAGRLRATYPDVREVRPHRGSTTILAAGRDLVTNQSVRSRIKQLPRPDFEGLRDLMLHRVPRG